MLAHTPARIRLFAQRGATRVSFDADLNACAALVERGDPLRFRAAMAAPVDARRILFPLYAFNVEVARAPWVTQEPMIAEMRLQWWRDVCEEIQEGKPVRRHEVVSPLASFLTPEDAKILDTLIAARRWDIYRDPFEDTAHFKKYMDQTAGGLTWVAARRLGQADEQVVRDAAFAAGIAAWFHAIPELESRGRVPLIDGTPEGVAQLAQTALDRLDRARKRRAAVSGNSRSALWHIGAAEGALRKVREDPKCVARGELGQGLSEDRWLAWRALTGRW